MMDECDNFAKKKKAILCAVTFWNLAVLPVKEQEQAIKESLKILRIEEDSSETEKIMKIFNKRKKKFYPVIN